MKGPMSSKENEKASKERTSEIRKTIIHFFSSSFIGHDLRKS